jgi:hypothetical protein
MTVWLIVYLAFRIMEHGTQIRCRDCATGWVVVNSQTGKELARRTKVFLSRIPTRVACGGSVISMENALLSQGAPP